MSNNQQNNSGSISAAVSVNRQKVLDDEIDRVHLEIERCIQAYMNMDETIDFLSARKGIDPRFAKLVWQKLEEDNPEFFRAYYIRLVLSKQINKFNQLLEHQVKLMVSHDIPIPGNMITSDLHISDLNIPLHVPAMPNDPRQIPNPNSPMPVQSATPSAGGQSEITFEPNAPIDSGSNVTADPPNTPGEVSSGNKSKTSGNQ